jgi:cAMP-specific phosphodiesterase 4/calcium/calmodulin-dependent 3',5'-cyclic nucleotide phosphodiesterase
MFKKPSKSFMQHKKINERESFGYETLNRNSSIYIDHLLKINNYDLKQILDKEFDIFELKQIVGQNNVLPVMGGVILEAFGLKNEKIINVNKLEAFLNSVSSQYLPTTLYHNNMHGADVCQSVCLYFLNSNAEKILQTTVLDLLSILIASLGHDLGHPGLNNNFHINARTDLALTYNDSSCLENFHCSKLFNILKKDETNILEVLSVDEFKDIRKRMISEILATDMFFHKKIIETTKSKAHQIKQDKFEFINNDKDSIKAEQQSFLDYFIHAADLGHNSKLFKISIKWVELLSKEFWLQGDKEKSLGISVSFLCDRLNTNVPKGQVNFLTAFILPTFGLMTSMFPGLSFTQKNVENNIKEWQKLADENRQRGWTPKKVNKEEEKDIGNNSKKAYKLGGGFNIKTMENSIRKLSD